MLFAFVSDVAGDVEEGLDGIEHMSDFYHQSSSHCISLLSQDVWPQALGSQTRPQGFWFSF